MPAETADVVAVEVIADLSRFDRPVKQSANEFGRDMGRIKASADAAEKGVSSALGRASLSAKQLQQNTRQLGFQISDIGTQLAAGTSPFLVLAQQGSQVANALEGARGVVGRFAAFLTGPYGAALLAVTGILGVLIGKNLEFGNALDDEIDKLKEDAEKTATAARAKEAFGNTIEGVTQALAENRKALNDLAAADETAARRALEAAIVQNEKAKAIRQTTIELLEQAKASEKAVIAAARFAGVGGDAAQAGVRIAQERIAELDQDLARANRAITESSAQIQEALSRRLIEISGEGEVGAINRRYDAMIENARRAAVASGTVSDGLKKEVDRINEAREAELRRLRDTERERNRSNRGANGLPNVTRQEVADILGAPIISGQRTPAHNKHVGGSATSFHLGGPNAAVQAIDIPLTVNGKPLTKAGIRAMLEPMGVVIRELLGPGDRGHNDHFHVAFERRRIGQDQILARAERAAEREEQARVAEERRRQAFENELASLQGDEINARQALITSAEEIARLELESIEVARQKYDDNLASLVEQKKLTDDEAAQLRAINDERARLRAELVQRREDERKFRMAEAQLRREAAFDSESRSVAAELLQGQNDLATTQAERRDIERRLIELQYAEERARNAYLIGYYERLKTQEGISESELREAEAAAKIAALRNQSIEQRQANDTSRSDRRTAGPLESLLSDIPRTADEINEALEGIAAGGLATFTDALTDAIVNFKSLGDVALTVLQQITAALVRMAIQQLLLKALGALGGGLSGGGPVGFSRGGYVPRFAGGGYPGGGLLSGPGTGTSDSIMAIGPRGPVRVSNGEYIVRASSVRKLGRGRLDHMNLTGELPAFAAGGAFGGPANVPAIAAGGGGKAELSEDSVRRLAGVVAEAASTMPDVKLYPTLDPGAAMSAALASPGGQRAFFDFVNQNSARFKSAVEG